MFVYLGEIKVVQFYDITDARFTVHDGKTLLVGDIVSENTYYNGMFLPPIHSTVRFQSGKYDGFYDVVDWIFSDSTKMLRIKVRKQN